MIHKKKSFGDTPAPRLNYALGGGHEHKVEKVDFIPGTMMSEPVPLEKGQKMPDVFVDLDDILGKVGERTATNGNSTDTSEPSMQTAKFIPLCTDDFNNQPACADDFNTPLFMNDFNTPLYTDDFNNPQACKDDFNTPLDDFNRRIRMTSTLLWMT
jgi:hypothetical protein